MSFQLVSISMTRAPAPSRPLRNAIDTLVPTICSSSAVSVVSREIISPVRVCSNQAGDKVSRWENTWRRMSAMTRSPSQEIK